MSIKIYVTGDNHIGLRYASHPQSAVLAEARIKAFEKMVEAANDEGCDLFAITGDVFESASNVTKRDVQRIVGMLAQFRGTVLRFCRSQRKHN